MSLKSHQLSISTTPVKVNVDPDQHGGSWGTVELWPEGADVFIGGADVTAADGFKIPNGATYDRQIDSNEDLYAVTAAGTATLYVLQGGV